MDEGIILLISIIASITIIVVLLINYSHKQRMSMISNGIDITQGKSTFNKKSLPILFVIGIFCIAVSLTGVTGVIVESIIKSNYDDWDLSRGDLPVSKDIGYQVSFFLYVGLGLLFSFFKIRKWNMGESEEN